MRRDRTAVLHFASQVLRSLAGFGTTLIAARYFGASGLGVYTQIVALLFWLKLPSNSIKTAVSKRMSESEVVTGHFTAGLLSVLCYGVLAGAVIFAFEEAVNGYVNMSASHLIVGLLMTNIVFDVGKGGLIGRKEVAISGWLNTAEQVARLSAQFAFVFFGATVLGLVYGHLVSLFFFALVGLVFLRDRLRVPSRDEFNELWQFARYSWLGSLTGLALNWMDVVVLGLFVADDLIGIYQASWTLASFLALTSTSVGLTLFPELSELGADSRNGRVKQLVGDGLLFASVLLIPGGFGALVVGDRVLELYSEEFAAGALILVILIAARTLNAFGSQLVSALNGLDFPDVAFRINSVFFGTNLVLNFVLVYLFGWYGAAVATLVSSGVLLVSAWYALQREIGGINVPVRDIGLEVLSSVVMIGVVWVALPVLPRNLFGTAGAVAVGAVVYFVVLLSTATRIRGKVRTLVGA